MAIKKTDINKPWAQRASTQRNTRIEVSVKKIFIIYCEGENTEPEYFRSFPVNTETKVEVVGLGRSRLSLVKYILKLAKENEYLQGQSNYDPDRMIWSVFDMDTKGQEGENLDFNQAITLAKEEGLEVAYSNDSFELWFFLHFQYTDNLLHRTHYFEFLSQKFNINYEKDGKTKEFSQSLYSLLLPFQESALKYAEKLHKSHKGKDYCDRNPCTTVYRLIKRLNSSLKK